MKILVTIPKGIVFDSFFDDNIKQALSCMGEVIYNESESRYTEQELAKMIENVDVCITGWGDGPFSDEIIKHSNKLSIIAHTGGSVGGIITDSVYDKGIKVLSGNDIYAKSVAEGVICYILTSLRRIPYYIEKMNVDGWHEQEWFNEGLIGKRVGLVGFGDVSKHLLGFLKPFDCEIFVCSNHLTELEAQKYGIKKMNMEEIFSYCDVISIHLAQNSKTYHSISNDLLGRIKRDALFVNTSRGSIVDENALVRTINKNRYRAILDVYETEPLPKDSILRNNENIILIPHMAGPTIDKRRYVTSCLIEEIKNVISGKDSYLSISKEKMHFMTK